MMRTQVYLTKEQHGALQRAAERDGVSMTEQLRRLIDRQLLSKGAEHELTRESVFSFVGCAESGASDVAERHDDFLAEAFRGAHLR